MIGFAGGPAAEISSGMKQKARGHALKPAAEPAALPNAGLLIGEIRELGFKYIRDKDYTSALFAFKKLLELNNKDVNARYVYAHLIDDCPAKRQAEARDMLFLSILDENPVIFEHPTEANLDIIRVRGGRGAATSGPSRKAIELFPPVGPRIEPAPAITPGSAKS